MEIPLVVWWIVGLVMVFALPEMKLFKTKLTGGTIVLGALVVGVLLRWWQIGTDVNQYSQR